MRKYKTLNFPNALPESKTLLTGIRGVDGDSKDKVYISGFYEPPTTIDSEEVKDGDEVTGITKVASKVTSFIYKGCLHGRGKWYELNFPDSTVTNLYGPNNGKNSKEIQVVGNYTTTKTGSTLLGCLYEGPLKGTGNWTTIVPKSLSPTQKIINTICHSTNGGLVVGNYDTILVQGKAFIYDIKLKKYYEIAKNGSKSITAYGIWYNSENSKPTYTICGGYSNLNLQSGVSSAYLVDWNNDSKEFSNWRSYSFNNSPVTSLITHFDGITTDGNNGYNLTGDSIGADESSIAFFVNVPACTLDSLNIPISSDGKKSRKSKMSKVTKITADATWSEISYPVSKGKTSGNSVYQSTVIGVYSTSKGEQVNGYISLLV